MPSRAPSRWPIRTALVAIGCGLAGEAWAQVSDVAQGAVTAGKAADVFLTQGPLGAIIVAEALVICALAGVIAYLFKKLDGQSTASIAMVREVTVALQANTAATAAGNVTIAALDRTLQATDDGVEKLSQQTALTAQATQSRGEEIIGNQRSILGRVETMQGALGKLDGIAAGVEVLRGRP